MGKDPRMKQLVLSVRTFILLSMLASLSACSMVSLPGLGSSDSQEVASAKPDYSSRDYVVKARYFAPTQPKVAKLPGVALVVNPEVKREIANFSQKRRRCIESAIRERGEHISTLSQIFHDEGVPPELINVALLESGFNPEAESPAGAKGMWQFMKSTARYYGLKIGLLVDQRKDLILSSLAAARHLKDLYTTYDDWYLALAAYNAGPGGVDKAIRQGGSRDFWTLARKGMFTQETTDFVPRFLAAAIIMKDLKQYGFPEAALQQTAVG